MVRVLPADLVLGQQLLWPELSPPWPLAVLAAWPGAVASWYSFDHETRPWMTSQEYACGECLAPIIAPKWLLKWN
jgi:hypothetical protein